MAQPRACLTLSVILISACAQHRPPPPAPPAPSETVVVDLDEGTDLAFDASSDGRWLVIDLLGQLWRVPAGGGPAVPITDAVRDTAEDREPAIAPDGKRVAFRGERGGRQGLWLLEADGTVRQLTQLANPDGYDGAAAWAPDGRSLAFTRLVLPDSAFPRPRGALGILEGPGAAVRILPLPGAVGPNVADPSWHPDGRRIAVVARRSLRNPGGRIWLVDTVAGSAVPLTDSVVTASGPVISPAGDRIAYFAPDADRRVQVWTQAIDRSTPPVRLTSHADVTPTSIAWTPGGERLLYGADGKLWSVALAAGAPAQIPFTARLAIRPAPRTLAPARFAQPGKSEPVRGFMGLALSPDGRRIGMIALGTLWVLEIGGPPREVAKLPDDARYLSWSPDGSEVAWSAGRMEHEDVFATDLARRTTRRVTSLPGREAQPAWSPDGRSIAFIHVAPQQEPRLRLAPGRGAVVSDTAGVPDMGPVHVDWTGTPAYAPVWSPDGARVLAPVPNYDATRPARAAMLRRSGGAPSIVPLADSPIFVQWAAGALVYVRHARLWRLPFDSTGARGAPEPLGDAPALFPSLSTAGDVLYVSEDGLVVRSPSGAERHLGWPLRYTPPVSPPLLIRNVRIIDGSGSPPSSTRDLLVERGRIARIEPAGTIRAGADTVDADGQFLIPGLMDLHAHTYAPELLPGVLYFGITTVRDQGAPIGSVIAYADAITAGTYAGPRVSYGGFQFYSDWAFDAEDGQGIEPEADSAHVRRAVGLAAGLGAQHIKTRTFRRWDINARMVLEAHRRGLRTTGHCAHQLPLVAVGFDTKEHAGFCNSRDDAPIYSDLVRVFRAAGVSVVPTVVYTGLAAKLDRPDFFESDRELAPFVPPITSDDWMLRLDSISRRRMVQTTTVARSMAAALVRAGVTIGTGTDVWQVPSAVHMELEELVAAGLTPLQAIRAATGDAARIIGAEGELGTIAVGKRADFVLLTADPTTDIRNTRRIRAVIQDGRVVNRAAIRARYDAIRSP